MKNVARRSPAVNTALQGALTGAVQSNLRAGLARTLASEMGRTFRVAPGRELRKRRRERWYHGAPGRGIARSGLGWPASGAGNKGTSEPLGPYHSPTR